MVFERKVLGKFLKEKRLKKNYSQSYVSNQLGYKSPQFISNWERGVSAPPLKVLPNLAKLYDLPAKELIKIIVDETICTLKLEFKMECEELTNESLTYLPSQI